MKSMIEDTIRRAIPDAEVHVESADGTHWSAVVVSASFAGMSLVRQHQQVMAALRSEFDSERVHALQLRTLTPERFRAELEERSRRESSPLPIV
jgi:acid stress-induced BolA-like protein IbaG/YrbA